ncbi:MAG: hypothetical protein HPZ91_19240 [Lentisphaeria bacterium]|nr:hypothetical protein [Lentisphaeria bacterium]
MGSSSIFDRAGSPRLIGHRGYTPAAPENSLPAFEAAGKLGMWAVETDVHMTRDGVPVCCHNADTGGGFDAALPIADSTFAELRKLRIVRGNGADKLPPESLRLPSFREYLEICRKHGAVPFVESKTADIGRILAELEELDMLACAVLSSIEFGHLEACRRLNRKIFIHHIFSTPEQMLRVAELGNGGVSWNCPDPAAAPAELIGETHRRGVRACLRAADTRESLRLMLALKLDYIPTNLLTPEAAEQEEPRPYRQDGDSGQKENSRRNA